MKKITKLKLIIGGITLISLIVVIGMSYFIGSQVFMASTQLVTNEGTTGVGDSFFEKYGINYDEFYSTYNIEKIEIISSFDGHVIPADYIFATESGNSKDNKTVILVHGLGGNRYSNYPVAEMFLEQGYNVLTYDQRSSNENTAQYTTFGFWEKYDLIDYIDYIRAYAPEQFLGVWGTSFGGATAGLALGYSNTVNNIDFLVLDCPVSSMKWMVEEEMRNMDIGIPVSYMTLCGNVVNKLNLGFAYSDAEVSEAVSNINIPVLIINSEVDTVTPYFMGKDIYDSIQGENKKIWTVSDSKHTEMWLDHNQEYRDKVAELLESIK